MSDNPLITVIVPVYKVEKYLAKCIDSILVQEYKNIEIILVDDGSPDACGRICDEYKQKDERIIVIHKDNGGLSDARNAALDIMQGELVTFIDSDDYVSEFYISHLYKALCESDADIAVSWFENISEGALPKSKKLTEIENVNVYTPIECMEKMFYQDGVETTAWGKLYKSELFSDRRYPVGKLYEDILVTYTIVESCKKIAVISNIDYFYLQRSDSIQYGKFSPAKMDGIIHMQQMKLMVAGKYPQLKKAVYCRSFSFTCNILFQINDIACYTKEFEYMWDEIVESRKCVLFNRKGRKKARAAALLSYFGYSVMKKIYFKTQMRAQLKREA